MDPLSQGVIGAIAAQSHSKPANLGKAALIGAIAGMAADLDILIRSTTDPLLSLQYHRHFTHALAFIPIGGLLCSLVLYPLLAKRWNLSYKITLLWCLLGYATHALLDSCTSYGTQLLWPFSNLRVAWDTISIIDPLLTLPLLALVISAAIGKKRRLIAVAAGWFAVYMSFGVIQHERAVNLGYELAESRNHNVIRLEAKPSFANLAVWKIIYETDDKYHVAAVRPDFNGNVVWQGDSINKLDISRDLPWLDKHSQQARDIQRFSQFSNGFIAQDTHNPNRIIDMRYSMLPHQIKPLWGIELAPEANGSQHAQFYTERSNRQLALEQLWEMISH